MNKEETKIESQVRRFFLGEMADSERSSFEEEFIANESLFEQVQIGEDELIESFVRGSLSAEEKHLFEQNYLTSQSRRVKLAFTRSLLARLSDAGAAGGAAEAVAASPASWASIAAFFSRPAPAFGAAFAILMAVFGGWYILRTPEPVEVAEQRSAPPQVKSPKPAMNETVAPTQGSVIDSNSNQSNVNGQVANVQPSNRISNSQKPKAVAETRMLALFAGTLRSQGKTTELSLPKSAGTVVLQLNLEAQDYKVYSAQVLTADGEVISKSARLAAKSRKINLPIPAALLTGGDYLVKLSAVGPAKQIESVADYTFRVNRK